MREANPMHYDIVGATMDIDKLVGEEIVERLNHPATATVPEPTPPRLPTRIVVMETVYYQPHEHQPQVFEARYTDYCQQPEQPYMRHTQVGTEWTPLDLGWAAGNLGLVLIKNTTTPPPSKRTGVLEQPAGSNLEVSIADPPMAGQLLLPGQSVRLYPTRADLLRLRASNGTQCKYMVVAFTR